MVSLVPEPIWQRKLTLEAITELHRDTAVARLGIRYIEMGDDYLRAEMPVNEHTIQPRGVLHGGSSLLLAESLASTAAYLSLPEGRHAVGLEINGNHVRSVPKGGRVIGTAKPLHRGRSTQVWQVEIRDEQERLACASRVTMAVLD